MTAERLAFNVGLYAERENLEQRLASDLAALVLETAERPDDRITPFTYIQTGANRLECPQFAPGQDIREILSWKTALDKLESQATLEIRSFILAQEKTPFVVVWINPPAEDLGYPEGRIVVAFGKSIDGIKVVENYGLCVDFSPETCLSLANQLLSFSEAKKELETINQVHATPIFLDPKEAGPVDFIAQHIPLPHAWERIKSDRAKLLGEQAFKEAQLIAQRAAARIRQAKSQWEYIVIGAQMEQQMAAAGRRMRAGSGCGSLNTEILSGLGSPFISHDFQINSRGEISLRRSERGTFVRKCPHCGETINKHIDSGYRCTCGKVYSGSCKPPLN